MGTCTCCTVVYVMSLCGPRISRLPMDALLTLSRPYYNKLQDYKMTKIMVMNPVIDVWREILQQFSKVIHQLFLDQCWALRSFSRIRHSFLAAVPRSFAHYDY